MMNVKDHVEVAVDPSGDRHGPAPDSTTQYLRRRSTVASAMSPQVYIEAELYTGWSVHTHTFFILCISLSLSLCLSSF
jgi:hypothetical protein